MQRSRLADYCTAIYYNVHWCRKPLPWDSIPGGCCCFRWSAEWLVLQRGEHWTSAARRCSQTVRSGGPPSRRCRTPRHWRGRSERPSKGAAQILRSLTSWATEPSVSWNIVLTVSVHFYRLFKADCVTACCIYDHVFTPVCTNRCGKTPPVPVTITGATTTCCMHGFMQHLCAKFHPVAS